MKQVSSHWFKSIDLALALVLILYEVIFGISVALCSSPTAASGPSHVVAPVPASTSSPAPALSPDLTNVSKSIEIQWYSFRTNLVYGRYYSGESTSGGVFWTPGVSLSKFWSARVQLGGSLFGAAGETFKGFLAPEIQLLAGFEPIKHLRLEAGGGLQKWMVHDVSTMSILTGNIHYVFRPGLLGFVDSVYLGYSQVYEVESHPQIKIGMQVGF